MSTKKGSPKAKQTTPVEKAVNNDLPVIKVTSFYANGKNASLVIENATVRSNNLNKPYKTEPGKFPGQTLPSYSSSVAIELDEKTEKEIYDFLAKSFNDKGTALKLALESFLTKKIRTLDDGTRVIYASVKWDNVNGKLVYKKALKISGLERGEKIPFSFVGDLAVGFSFSVQNTFAIYFNGFILKEVLKQESDFKGFDADTEYSPSVEVEAESQANIQDEIEEVKKETEKESFVSKVKNKKFW